VVRLAVLLALVASCYSPRLPEGVSCDVDNQCPLPQRCVASQCTTRAIVVDAAADAERDADVDAPPPPVADAEVDAPPDAPPDAAPPACALDGVACANATVVACGGSCWLRCTTRFARTGAQDACAAWGGHLAEILSDADQQCAASVVASPSWLGLAQPVEPQAAVDLGWTWNGAIPWTRPGSFDNFNAGRPDDDADGIDGAEQCAQMSSGFSGGLWDDIPCTSALSLLCQRPAP